jgi:hypothetical protein
MCAAYAFADLDGGTRETIIGGDGAAPRGVWHGTNRFTSTGISERTAA